MPLQDVVALPALTVPEPDRRVVAGRGQGAAIAGPGQPGYCAAMSFQRRPAGASFHVPELDRLVGAGAGEAAAGEQISIRSEGQPDDQVAMPMQFLEQRPLFGIPQPNDRILAAAGEPTSIRTPGYSQNRPTRRVQTRQGCSCYSIPKVHGSIMTSA